MNIEARSRNHCYSGKSIRITYSECVSVALGTQNVMRMRHIVICGLSKKNSTLVQALRLCTGRTAHRRSRGIALLFYDQRH
jgi:hypothetical protein